jgi:alpha-L-fucosidase
MTELRAQGFPGRTNMDNRGNDIVGGGGIPRHGYSPQDLRFSTKGSTLYVFLMAWPESHHVTIKSLAKQDKLISKVELLGTENSLKFVRGDDGLTVTLPDNKPSDFINTLKITMD